MELEGPNIPETPASDANEKKSSPEPEPALTGRRVFFARFVEFAAACVAVLFAIPFVRYLLYPVSVRGAGNAWSSLGPYDQLASMTAPLARLITVSENDGWLESQSKRPIYITKDAQGRVEVLTAVCPHLGCTIQWSQSKDQFLCPCHGSVFAADGAHIAGPTPRGMDSLPTKVQDGQLLVRYEDFRQLLPAKEVLD